MYYSNQTAQGGQSHTLEITKLADGKTQVTAPHCPGVQPVTDDNERFAVLEMKRQLDDWTHKQGQPASPLLLPGGDDY
jgi:hypothetical protein